MWTLEKGQLEGGFEVGECAQASLGVAEFECKKKTNGVSKQWSKS